MKQTIRDNVPTLLEGKGFMVKVERLSNEEHKSKLCSLFWHEYEQNLFTNKVAQLQVHYAEMLEVIRTLMVMSKTNVKEFDFDENQAVQWYKNSTSQKQKLEQARMDMLEKFSELLKCETEAIRDQLKDLLISFKHLVDAHGISFAEVEKTRREIYKKLGGYNTKTYLAGVAKPYADEYEGY